MVSLGWLIFTACTSPEDELVESTVVLTVENFTDAQLWYFQHTQCGADSWTDVIAADEYVAAGSTVSSSNLSPGCYELYVEDEYGCYAFDDTDGNIAGGMEYTLTLSALDKCY